MLLALLLLTPLVVAQKQDIKIGIVTAETQADQQVGRVVDLSELLHKSADYFDIFKQNKRDWSAFQGYEYTHHTLVQHSSIGPSGVSWAQIDLLERQLVDYDWVVWLDMDTIVVDLTLQVETFIQRALAKRPHADVILEGSEDFKQIRSGVMLIKNTAWSKKLLRNLKLLLSDQLWLKQSRRGYGSLLDRAIGALLQSQHESADAHVFFTNLQDRWNQPLVYLPKVGVLHFSGCHVGDVECLHVLNAALNHLIEHETMYVYQYAPYIQHIYNIFAGIYVIFALDRLYHVLGRYFGPDRLLYTAKSSLPETSDISDPAYPMVAVQLPMFNETSCAETIIDAAAQLEWPMHRMFIQVVDDSTSKETRDVIDARVRYWRHHGVSIDVKRRPHREGFKAGAMNEAMEDFPNDNQYIAIFDADFLPQPKFLLQTVPYLMANDNVAFVQTCWAYTNAKESLLTRMQEISLNFHFFCEQESRFRMGKFFNFNGTAGLWRQKALVNSGGWHTDTLVEDMDLSLRAYALGWDFIFLKDVKCLNEVPPTFGAYRGQQHRWTSGPMQVLKKAFRTVYDSQSLSFSNKVFCLWFFLRNYVHIVNFMYFLVLIPMMIWVPRITLYDWAVIYLPMAISMSNVLFTPSECARVFVYVLFENAMCLYKTGALICGVLNIGKAKTWIVTPKFARQKFISPQAPDELKGLQEQGPVHQVRASTPDDLMQQVKYESPSNSPIMPSSRESDSTSLPEFMLDSPSITTVIDMPAIQEEQVQEVPRPSSRLVAIATAYKFMKPNVQLHRNELVMCLFLFACSYFAYEMRQFGIGAFCLLNSISYLILGLSYIGSR